MNEKQEFQGFFAKIIGIIFAIIFIWIILTIIGKFIEYPSSPPSNYEIPLYEEEPW